MVGLFRQDIYCVGGLIYTYAKFSKSSGGLRLKETYSDGSLPWRRNGNT